MSRLSNPEIFSINNEVNDLKAKLKADSLKSPSMQMYDPIAVQQDIDKLEGKIALHNDFIAVEKKKERDRLQSSKKVLEDTLKQLQKTADMLDKKMPDIHHLHKGRLFEIKNILRQTLR